MSNTGESWPRRCGALLGLSDRELAKALGAVEANHSVTQVRVLALLLCQLSKPQAYRLLQRLVHRELLTATTQKGRNVRYRKKET